MKIQCDGVLIRDLDLDPVRQAVPFQKADKPVFHIYCRHADDAEHSTATEPAYLAITSGIDCDDTKISAHTSLHHAYLRL